MSERPDAEGEWEDVVDESGADGSSQETEAPTRRGFLAQFGAAVVGALATLVPAAVGLFVVTGPLRRGDDTEPALFLPVAKLDALPADGLPHAFPVIKKTVNDAWNRYHNVPVGSVYLIRTQQKPQEVTAFNTTCPHLGCYVDKRDDGSYHCPCHNSEFKPDGSRGKYCVSPRGLDSLAAKVDGEEIVVQFKNFKVGVEESIELR